MFTKSNQQDDSAVSTQSSEPKQRSGGLPLSIITENLSLTGTLACMEGELQIDGKLNGDLYAKKLTIGKTARIEGTICGDDVTLAGEVVGHVHAKVLRLRKSATISGNVCYAFMEAENGMRVEGFVSHRPEESFEFTPALDKNGWPVLPDVTDKITMEEPKKSAPNNANIVKIDVDKTQNKA